ncbi:MAG: 23S rRNA (pseudouridine(1915)-N(3))-methyltransferase RlmH [Bacilli bacterium]
MLKIKIVCVGKLKEKYYVEMQNEYVKRLSRYIELNIIEVKDEKIDSNSNAALDTVVKDKEFENIKKVIKENDYIVLLDLKGTEYDSIELSEKFNTYLSNSLTNVTFIIGGSLGFSAKIEKLAKEKIKLSHLTLTHQMSRVILLEQIYRSFKILNNETYHK